MDQVDDSGIDNRKMELLALTSLVSSRELDDKNSSTVSDDFLRHVSPNRLWDILSSLNLKSLLFSPLGAQDSGAAETEGWSISALQRGFHFNRESSRQLSDARFDLVVRSLEHKFSVYAHKMWLEDADEFVPAAVFCAAAVKSGEYVVSGADDSLIKIWNVDTGRLAATLRGHTAEVCELKFSACMSFLVSLCQDDKSVILWRRSADGISYKFMHRFTELNGSQSKLKPAYFEFASGSVLKLFIAYAEGRLVAYQVSSTVHEYNRASFEPNTVDYFSLLPQNPDYPDHVDLVVSLSRRHGSPFLMAVTVPIRGTPREVEYGVALTPKSRISNIASAHRSSSFLVNDDEAFGSVILFRENPKNQYDTIFLIRGQSTGDALLGADDSSLMDRLGLARTRPLLFSVTEAVFSLNDEFVLVAVAGHPKHPSSIGDDDQDSVYCVLVFSVEGPLRAVLGAETCQDQIFCLGLLEPPAHVSRKFTYVYYASYDGSLTLSKIHNSVNDQTVVEELTRFNISTRHGANMPRSILDCNAVVTDEGDIVIVTGDAMGAVSVFSTNIDSKPKFVPSEQFFLNDYEPVTASSPFALSQVGFEQDFTRVTTVQNGGVLGDSSLTPLTQLANPSPPIVDAIIGSQFEGRFDSKPETQLNKFETHVMKKDVSLPAAPPTPTERVGRPRLTDEERARRASEREQREARLRSLAAARAAMAEEESDEYTRTASGRVVRRMNSRHIPESEFELYENSEIDDSSFETSSVASSSSGRRRSARRTPPRPSRREVAPPEPPHVIIPTRMKRDEYVDRSRWIRESGEASALQKCTLCGLKETVSDVLLGAFQIADLPDCYMHADCLFSLTGLAVLPMAGPDYSLAFGNLDVLVRRALHQGRCAYPECKHQRLGAGVKCFSCRSVFHYQCALSSASKNGYLLDPLFDPFFVCPRCEPPAGLEEFSRRRKWRSEETVRAWLLHTHQADVARDTLVPQVGDMVYYYPPKVDWDRPRNSNLTSTKLVSELVSSKMRSTTDLALLTWWPWHYPMDMAVPARVERIEYVFPPFSDPEEFSVIQKLFLTVETRSSRDGYQGMKFVVHYRPQANASDVIVVRERVDRALSTRFHTSAKIGSKVSIPIDLTPDGTEKDISEGTIVGVKNDPTRPGWECFDIKQDDGEGTFSLWELDLTAQHVTDIPPLAIPRTKAQFLVGWIERIVAGPCKNSRNRIDIGPGMDIFQVPPWKTPGAEKYLEIIPYPMWFDLVVERLAKAYYRSLDELKRDITCISLNCAVYNDPSSEIVVEAEKLTRTVLMLVDLPEADHVLYSPPALAVDAHAPTQIRVRATSSASSPPPTSIRAVRKRTLTCDHCGAEREVPTDVYNEYTSTGKRVKCRWINYTCEDLKKEEPQKNVQIKCNECGTEREVSKDMYNNVKWLKDELTCTSMGFRCQRKATIRAPAEPVSRRRTNRRAVESSEEESISEASSEEYSSSPRRSRRRKRSRR